MPEILLNKETFEGLSFRFDSVFSRAIEASNYAYKAETVHYVSFMLNSNLQYAKKEADSIHNVMKMIVDSFSEVDNDNREKALKIRETYVGPHSGIINHIINGPTIDIRDVLGEKIDPAYMKNKSPYNVIKDAMEETKVDYVPVSKYDGDRTESEIIDYLAGDDRTIGSCASVAYAYAASKGGYDVKDYRGDASSVLFSSSAALYNIEQMKGVVSYQKTGYNEIKNSQALLKNMEPGKEYILFSGQHAAVVRLNGKKYEYLELQTTEVNNPREDYNKGWHELNEDRLKDRFMCDSAVKNFFEYDRPTVHLVEVDSLANNKDFIKVSGYYNTQDGSQVVGVGGGMK